MNKRERTERARQEDAVLNKVLYWIVGAVVLEFLLLLVNRFYIKYTVATIGTANAIEAVLTHGIFKGSWLALRRILRCHPWSSGGYDPVPPPHSSSFSHQEQLDHHGR